MCITRQPAQREPMRLAAPRSDTVRRSSEMEAALRRMQAGMDNDVLTTPLGLSDANPVMGT